MNTNTDKWLAVVVSTGIFLFAATVAGFYLLFIFGPCREEILTGGTGACTNRTAHLEMQPGRIVCVCPK